jgi:MSHA pilin protein MshC
MTHDDDGIASRQGAALAGGRTPVRRAHRSGQAGFTLVELVLMLVLIGVLAATVAPRLSGSAIDEVRFYNETLAFLRYAQKTAISQRRKVCVAFTATAVTATVSSSFSGACGSALTGPGGVSPYSATAQNGAGFSSTPSPIVFDAAGAPDNPQSLALVNSNAIVVEPGSGYVH